MSSNPSIGIAFNAKQFNDEVKVMTDNLKLTKKEFQLTNSEIKKSGDALATDVGKIQAYNKQLEQQKEITVKLKKGLSDVTNLREEEKKRLEEVTKALDQAKASEKSSEKEIAKLEKTLKSATNQYNKAESNVDRYNIKLADSRIAENNLENAIDDTNEAIKQREFATLTNDLGTVNNGLSKVAKGFLAIGTATAAGTLGLFKMSSNAAIAAKEIQTMSQRVGFSTQAYQEWEYIASKAGTTMDTLQGGITDIAEKMDDAAKGTGEAAEIFDRLRINVTGANGELRSQQEVFVETITALQNMSNASERQALATKLMSTTGEELLPLLNGQIGTIDELTKKTHDLGIVMSDEAIKKGVAFADNLDIIKKTAGAVASEIGTDLMPMFEGFMNSLEENSEEIGDTIENVVKSFASFVVKVYEARGAIGALVGIYLALKTALTITTAVMALRKAMEATTLATKGAQAAQVLFNATCMANPYVAVAVVLGTLTAGFLGYKLMAGDAAEATKDFNTELQANIDTINQSEVAKKSEIELNKSLAKELDILAQKEDKTNIEKERMKSLAEELNKAYSDLNLPIANIAGQYMNYKSAIDGVITSAEKLIQIEASRDRAVAAQQTIYNLEEKYNTSDYETTSALKLRNLSAQMVDTDKIPEDTKYRNYRVAEATIRNREVAKEKAALEAELKAYYDAKKLIDKYSDLASAPTSTEETPKFKYEGQSPYDVVKGVLVYRDTGKPVKQNTNSKTNKASGATTAPIIAETTTTETVVTQEVKDLYNERLAISQKYIDDKKFYDNWGADNEISALERVKEWTKDYYNKGTIDYARYTKEIADIDKDLYTARKSAIEQYVNEEYNSQRKLLDDRRTALDDYYTDIENKEKAQDRATDRAELVELEKQYQFAVTAEGKNKLKDIQDNIKNLDKQQQEEYRQLEKAEKVKELSKEYDKLEASQLEVMKNISSYAQETATTLENITLRIAGLVSSVMGTNTAGTNTVTQNNYNTIADPTSAQIYGNVGFNNMRFLF